jgi:hypothetical protein
MSEKEVQGHLQEVLNLYRSDFSALKQGYEESFRSIKADLDTANRHNADQEKQVQYLRDENYKLQQYYRQIFDEYKRKIAEIERENRRLRETVALAQADYAERRASEKKAAEYEEGPPILDAFNRWAANPSSRALPSGFVYAEGEFRILSKNIYRSSPSSGSRWIVNTTDGKKYLLPNPLSFNQLTNINELYHMDMSRLQPANNKIKVVKACELLDEGYINYPGELTIL